MNCLVVATCAGTIALVTSLYLWAEQVKYHYGAGLRGLFVYLFPVVLSVVSLVLLINP